MVKPLNLKAKTLSAEEPRDARAYAFTDCCPGFAPGWEVGFDGSVDPCPWQSDIPACHPCFWSAQVPDSTTYPGWLDGCANVANDWRTLCVVPDV